MSIILNKRFSFKAHLNAKVHGACRVQFISIAMQQAYSHMQAMAKARNFIAANPQPRALFIVWEPLE